MNTGPASILAFLCVLAACVIGAEAVWRLLVWPAILWLADLVWNIRYQWAIKRDGLHPDDIERNESRR